jgi:hypothetical protein
MHRSRSNTIIAALSVSLALAACSGSDTPTVPDPGTNGARTPVTMSVLGVGDFTPQHATGEIFVRGTTAYTTTWSNRSSPSPFYIWDVSSEPTLVDSVMVANSNTLGDIAITPDGAYLVVATEYAQGAIVIYSLANPRKPTLVSRFSNLETTAGVHTAEVGLVNGKPYAFLSVDPGGSVPAKLVIVDLSNPAAPQQVFSKFIGNPYVHDTFIRDGLLFLGLWNDGVAIWDLGGGGKGGTPAAPVELGRVKTINGHVHNIWWLKDPVTSSTRYAFIGEESPASVGTSSSGDVHVVDVSNMSAPREVAFYTVPGAGTHNFSVDEANGILYAAYYNGGVRALDVRGDLGTCSDAQKSTPTNSTAALCDLTKMGRELGIGLLDRGNPVYIWGVQWLNGSVYASDMLGSLWKMRAVSRP